MVRVRLLAPLLLGLGLVAGCTSEVELEPPTASGLTAAEQTSRGQVAVSALVTAINERDPAALADIVVPSEREMVAAVLRNAETLEVGRIESEYVDTTPAQLSEAQRADLGPAGAEAWVAEARLSYRLPLDGAPSRHEIAVVLVPDGDGARVVGLGGHGTRSPLWLIDEVDVQTRGRVTVLNAGDRPTTFYVGLGARALTDVARVLPEWKGPLFLEVPRDKDQLDVVLAAQPDTYASIAGITSTADGSVVPGAPVHVYLNPPVFDTLKRQGAQVVVSHEATHVATDASFTSGLPTWLLEGFADYVALVGADVPVERAAAQAIKQMRTDGLPEALPSPEDLESTAEGLGATYEQAWLACRYLAQRYGEDALIDFYREVDSGTSVASAFDGVLGITEAEFMQGWRDHLRPLVESGETG